LDDAIVNDPEQILNKITEMEDANEIMDTMKNLLFFNIGRHYIFLRLVWGIKNEEEYYKKLADLGKYYEYAISAENYYKMVLDYPKLFHCSISGSTLVKYMEKIINFLNEYPKVESKLREPTIGATILIKGNNINEKVEVNINRVCEVDKQIILRCDKKLLFWKLAGASYDGIIIRNVEDEYPFARQRLMEQQTKQLNC